LLTAQGLSTPLVQTGCQQGTPALSSFAQAVILDQTAGTLSVYNPLIIDQGTKAAIAPIVPLLPNANTIAVWFGTNALSIVLVDDGAGSLAGGQCVQGILVNGQPSNFNNFAYCNAISFWVLAKNAAAAGTIKPAPLDMALDGVPCPTIRDFFIVDDTPGDGVTTTYLVTANGLAQNSSANFMANPTSVILRNTLQDNDLFVAINLAIGCKSSMITNLGDLAIGTGAGIPSTASALNELQAHLFQQQPIALVPLSDPATKHLGGPNMAKLNQLRAGLGQPNANTGRDADQVDYCFNIYLTAPLRLLNLMGALINYPSPDPNQADSLFTFLSLRFMNAFDMGLGCFDKLALPRALPPVCVNTNNAGVVVGVTITPPNNGPGNPIYAATTGAHVVKKGDASSKSVSFFLIAVILLFCVLV